MVKVNSTKRRTGRQPRPSISKTRQSTKKANAAGYAKRVSRKAQGPTQKGSMADDVYEYAPEDVRRSKIRLDLDKDEATDWGVGPDGEIQGDRDKLRARLIGENDENERIDSEDDEEIDSDAAFEESDDEEYAGFFKKNVREKSKKKSKSTSTVQFEVDLNEDDDENMEANSDAASQDASDGEDEESSDNAEEEEAEAGEFYDLLDILDGRAKLPEDQSPDEAPGMQERTLGQDLREKEQILEQGMDNRDLSGSEESSEEESDSGEQEEEQEDTMDFVPSDDEGPSFQALEDLQNFVAGLETSSKKRKTPEGGDGATSDTGTEQRARKRRALQEKTAAGIENEFSARIGDVKLDLEDLLAPLATQSSALQSLKKSTKALTSSKTKSLSAPLPQRAQERLDRQAAYEQTKEEVQKWAGTMKRIREAEHLSFPLQAPTAGRVSNLELAAKFKPTTQLESAVDTLLKSAKMREQDIQQTEDSMLQMNKLSIEEVAQRRIELRKMRELMFRAEMKAKRIAKIKSKTYRRIKRKEREKLGEKIDESDADGEEGEEKRLKLEYERAKERATLKHKYTGKWAKKMQGREGMDEETRRDIEEMLERGEKLRRRIQGVGSDESEGDHGESEDDDENDEGGDGGLERIKQNAFDEIRALDAEDADGAESSGKKGKSVFEMKFMKDAMARQQQQTDKMVDDFYKEMGGSMPRGDNSDEENGRDEDGAAIDPPSGVIAVRAGGRVVYRPGASINFQPAVRSMGSLASDTSSVTLKSTDLLSPPPPLSPEHQKRPTVPLPNESELNPWLAPQESEPLSGGAVKVARKQNEIIVSKESKQMDKSKNKLKKLARKREEEKAKAREDEVVEIKMDNVLKLDSPPSQSAQGKTTEVKGKSTKSGTASATPVPTRDEGDHDSDAHSEIEEQEKLLMKRGKGANASNKGLKAFEQRDLVALAFAGDNVVKQFEETKKRAIAEDAPREVDTTLPGWGSWGGTGTRKGPSKPHLIKKLPGIDPKSRADYDKAHIIISEKRDKKAAKYLVKDLPYPYTSQAQFERSMERPLGVEWNTRVGFQRNTLPKVVKKPGVIIDPLGKQHS
ncbi:hypothetical protein AX16_008063 [Volvariella volvacea WC 439]|nr:hypothetical protein AX16_008063 [Volvariella volvacea WC 439]